MVTTVSLKYNMEFTPAEFALIGRALRGALRPDEVDAAKNLQIEMCKQKIREFEHHGQEIEKLKKNIGIE